MINKLQNSFILTFYNAIWCGFLIQISVEIYKKYNKLIGILFCIPAFILAGFEHSIADMYYIIATRTFTIKSLIFIIIVIIGNGIGALMHKLLDCKDHTKEIKLLTAKLIKK